MKNLPALQLSQSCYNSFANIMNMRSLTKSKDCFFVLLLFSCLIKLRVCSQFTYPIIYLTFLWNLRYIIPLQNLRFICKYFSTLTVMRTWSEDIKVNSKYTVIRSLNPSKHLNEVPFQTKIRKLDISPF